MRFVAFDNSERPLIHEFTHFLHQSPTQVSAQLLDGETICFPKTELLAQG